MSKTIKRADEKWCNGCKSFKPNSGFCSDKSRKCGLASYCRVCKRNHNLKDEIKKATNKRWKNTCEVGGLSFWSNKLGYNKLYCSSQLIKQKYLADPNCFYCRVPLKPIETHIDHMISRSGGGSEDITNLVISCPDCNRLKWTKSASEFLNFLQTYLTRFANKAEDHNIDRRERLNEKKFIMSKLCESPNLQEKERKLQDLNRNIKEIFDGFDDL